MQSPISSFLSVTDLAKLTERDLPNTGDGKYYYQVAPKAAAPVAGPTAADLATHSSLSIFADKVKSAITGGAPIANPAEFIKATLQVLESPDAIDDRDGFFTQMLSLLCKIPQDTAFAKEANGKAIALLYNSLPHPPATYLGSDPAGVTWTTSASPAVPPHIANGAAKTDAAPAGYGQPPAPPRVPWAYRAADGSGHNPWMPALGQSGRPYARDVPSTYPLPTHKLPDAGVVFDALLRARGDFVPHPGGNSALTFAFASLVTHTLFRTSPTDATVNNTTSYVDLSPLYGTNQAEQDLVRNKAAGRGLLWNDAFAEDRLILVPPAASALLVVFSRNHNYAANILLKINERGRWKDPAEHTLTPAQLAQQDEEIFQTARNINCGHFAAAVFGDYVGGFLGLPRDGVAWSMDPFSPIKMSDGSMLGRGEGNHSSVEFNLLYRWHAVTAQQDIQWTNDLFAKVFPGTDVERLSVRDFGAAVGREWGALVDPNPRTRTFGGLVRGPDGSFPDDGLANILQTATETPAGAYRARGHPAVFRVVETMTIEQGRQWGVCTMNEFRKFLGLKPFATFEEWNSSVPGVAEAARQLYGHIDNLELYPGVQAEDCMPLGPGSGLCCGYTMTRAILGDAMSLVRGDRFFTTDNTPANLTTWGFQDTARDFNNGAYGAGLPKLLMRHLSRHYPGNSVYSLFPFITPPVMTQNLARLGTVGQYTQTDGKRPVPLPVPKVVDTIDGIRYVFKDPAKFKTTYAYDMKLLSDGYGFMLSDDNPTTHDRDKTWAAHAMFPDGAASLAEYATIFRDLTTKLIAENSYKIAGVAGVQVDIITNVLNLLTVTWASDYLIGIPLKTKETPKGLFTGQEVHDILSLLFTCGLINIQPENCWALEHGALGVSAVISGIINQNINDLAPTNPLSALARTVSNLVWPQAKRKPFHDFLARLKAAGRPNRDVVAEVVGLAVGGAMIYAQAAAQIVDFYLDDERADARAEIVALARADSQDPAQKALLLGYVREAQRLRPGSAALFRLAAAADTIPLGGGKSVAVQPGDLVFNSFKNAHLNPADFPDPLTVDPRRPTDRYQLQSAGFHECLGLHMSEHTLPEVLKAVFRLPRLRRAPGPAGRLAGFTLPVSGTENPVYLDDAGNLTYWPGSMILVYDE